jgi:hypothetical protein
LNAYLAKDGKPIAEYFDWRPDNAKTGVRALRPGVAFGFSDSGL